MFVAAEPRERAERTDALDGDRVVDLATSCAHPDAAWKFIKFDAGRKWSIAARQGGELDADCATTSADDPEIKADPMLAQFVQIGNNARSYPLPSPVWAEIAANDIVDAVQKALLAPEKTDEIFRDLDVRADEEAAGRVHS